MHRVTTVLAIAFALAAAAAAAAPAAASVTVAGTGEPAFTSSAQNTQWVHYSSSNNAGYKVTFDYYDNNVSVKSETVFVNANGSADMWGNWSGTTLIEGHTYSICATGFFQFPNDNLWFMDSVNSCTDGAQSGKRTYTTIDRTKPVVSTAIEGGAQYANSRALHYRIDYADNLSSPFPANFLCREIGGDPAQACQSGFQMNSACSVPAQSAKTTHFDCTDELPADAPDGPVTVCVISADSAVPDVPGSSNQTGSAQQANLSPKSCDSIVLDRTKPSLSIIGAAPVGVGQAVNLAAQAADGGSGLSAAYSWSWGDGAVGSGASASHTYSAAGTYEVTMTTHDVAGNDATAKATITVSAPPASPTPSGPAPAEPSTPTGPSAPAAPSAPASADASGGAASRSALDIAAPKKLARAKRALPLVLAATGAGRATFALVRSGKIRAHGAAVIRKSGTSAFRLKLPKGLKPGSYSLKVTWAPAIGPARTRTVKIAVKR
jgi:hypothetical protein